MTRFKMGVLLILTLTLPIAPRSSWAQAQEPKKPLVPTIKEIMREAHKCSTAYIRYIRIEMDKDEPDWKIVQDKSRELVRAGKLLALNTPPKGSAESWERITTLYTSRATVLSEAAEVRDLEEGRVVARRMQAMCSACHRAHK